MKILTRMNVVYSMPIGPLLLFLGLLVTLFSPANAAVNTTKETRTVQLKRGSTNIATTTTLAECELRAAALIKADGEVKTSGSAVYTCSDTIRWAVSFKANPPPSPTCTAPRPSQQSRDSTCPVGTTGTWHQTMDAVAAAYPTCWVDGAWTPEAPPVGMCAESPPAKMLVYTCADAGADGRILESSTVTWPNCSSASYKDPSRSLVVAINTGTQLLWRLASKVTTERVWTHTGTVGNWTLATDIVWPVTANTAPVISGTAPTSIQAGSLYSFTPTASDADADVLIFGVANKPSWATFSTATGRLSGTPTATNVGAYSNVAISVSDGKASVSLPSFAVTVNAVPASGSASLSWNAPTQNVDGTALTNLAGYRIYYGTSASALTKSAQVNNPGVTSYLIENLVPATYYFVVRAYTSGGIESANSNVASKTVQ